MEYKLMKAFVFIFFIILFDRIAGIICHKLYVKSNEYTVCKLRYTLDSTKEEILIFGSSRAQHHFVPSIIKQNTGMSIYNCGFPGEGLLFSLIQLNETLKRYKPKLIVVEISPNILLDPESHEKLNIVMPFYKRDPLIYDALTNGKILQKMKLLSSIYPYNSTIASLIRGCFKQKIDSLNGFIPLEGIIDTSGVVQNLNVYFPGPKVPSEKLNPLRQLIATCDNRNVNLILTVSPVYQTNANLDGITDQIKNICDQRKNVHFFDYSKYERVYKQNIFF